jgi:hypothetical protein
MTSYAIKTQLTLPGRRTMYVLGVNRLANAANFTDDPSRVKLFKSHAAADRFREKYGAYGSGAWEIVSATFQPSSNTN